jgi:hypothetical protein
LEDSPDALFVVQQDSGRTVRLAKGFIRNCHNVSPAPNGRSFPASSKPAPQSGQTRKFVQQASVQDE